MPVPDTASLTHVCVGVSQPVPGSRGDRRSAIDKRPADGPVAVSSAGLTGDEQADLVHHGGPDQALYAYAQEDADHWARTLSRDAPPGAFGENLRTQGLDVSGALIGERWRLGSDVEVQVAAARIPCSVFAGFWDVRDLIKRFLVAGRPGAYLRVLTPGTITAGDPVEVIARPDHDLTVADVLRIMTSDPGQAQRLLDAEGMGQRGREWALERIDRSAGADA